ncbi:MAG: hypothetical protein PHR57_02840 [Patescibacteria group bacterium]|nr:hypothetical protein [Patescibacteria group bacterium]
MLNSEGFFKFIFGFAIFLFCLITIGVFLIIVKIILLFMPEVNVMGLILSYH